LTRTFAPGCYALCEEENTGKSTLLSIVAGVVAPDSGDVWIDGRPLVRARDQALSRLAYVPDDCLQFPTQTGRGLLEQAALAKDASLDDDVYEFAYGLGLEPHLDKRFEQM